jgi:site-specific DNA-methyltransferase (cytosine-N4-specific)
MIELQRHQIPNDLLEYFEPRFKDGPFINRNMIIWYKPACMPSSAKDRFTVDFEPIFFFSKNPKYKFNQQLEPALTADRSFSGDKVTPIAAFPGSPQSYSSGSSGFGVSHDDLRNKRTVWRVNFEPQSEDHFASYPTKLIEPMILSGTDEGDTVMDIFNGTGTTGITALRHRRKYLGIELNEKYIEIANRRLKDVQVNLF